MVMLLRQGQFIQRYLVDFELDIISEGWCKMIFYLL